MYKIGDFLGGTAFDFWRVCNDSAGGEGVDGVLACRRIGGRQRAIGGGFMRKLQWHALIWALGAAHFALIGVSVALTAGGQWYLVLSAVILFVAVAVFSAKAVVAAPSAARAAVVRV
jgi:hypothetical protein